MNDNIYDLYTDYLRHDIKKDSVMPVKTDRKIAMGKDEVLRTYDDRRNGRYVQVSADRDGSRGIPHQINASVANAGMRNVTSGRLNRMLLRKNRRKRLQQIFFLLLFAATSGLKCLNFQVS
jgi:hypothetical protein